MSAPVGWGVAGCGWVARDHAVPALLAAEGTPEQVVDTPGSHTGEFLRPVLNGRRIEVAAAPEPLVEAPPPPQRRRRAS